MLRRSWDDEETPQVKPTLTHKTISPYNHPPESHYHEHVEKVDSRKRRKSSGLKNLLISLLVIGGFYFGAGAIVQNTGDESWQRKAKEYSILVWPRVFTMSETGGYGTHETSSPPKYQGYSTPQSSSRQGYNENSPTPSHSSISQEREEYEDMEEEAKRAGKEMVGEAKELSETVVKQLPLPIQRKNARKQIDKGFKKLEEMYDE